jgi:hypothetical protein
LSGHLGCLLGAITGREQVQQPVVFRKPELLDHLVGTGEQDRRHVEAERLGGLEVDHQLELDRGLDRKLARLRLLEDAIGIIVATPGLHAHAIVTVRGGRAQKHWR